MLCWCAGSKENVPGLISQILISYLSVLPPLASSYSAPSSSNSSRNKRRSSKRRKEEKQGVPTQRETAMLHSLFILNQHGCVGRERGREGGREGRLG